MSHPPEPKPKDSPDTYFQFPLSALGYDLARESRWTHLVLYCCRVYGAKSRLKTPPHVVSEVINDYMRAHPQLNQIDLSREDHKNLLFGLSRLHVTARGDIRSKLISARELEDGCEFCPYPLVRIRTDLFWKTFNPKPDDNPISFREFSVLCAVYAGIGNKAFAKLSHQQLIRYAAGYPNLNHFRGIQSEIPSAVHILSRKKIRLTLDRLEVNKFFQKYTFNRGECFYTNKLSKEQLHEAVKRLKVRRDETLYESRKADRAASDEICQLKRQMRSPWKDYPNVPPNRR